MAPGSPFGPDLTALILHLHVTQAIGFERLVRLLDEVFGIRISEGAIANMLVRAGAPLTAAARPRRRGDRMRRRELMLLLGGAMTAARALRAQQKAMPVIGYLSSASPGPAAPYVAAFRQGLSETGYVEGQNLAIEYRWAEGSYDRLPALAADLVGRKVDLIVASGGDAFGTGGEKRDLDDPDRLHRTATRSRAAWSPVSPGRAATSRASASSPSS